MAGTKYNKKIIKPKKHSYNRTDNKNLEKLNLSNEMKHHLENKTQDPKINCENKIREEPKTQTPLNHDRTPPSRADTRPPKESKNNPNRTGARVLRSCARTNTKKKMFGHGVQSRNSHSENLAAVAGSEDEELETGRGVETLGAGDVD
ncbi:hypothetical protein CRENBAI_002209 [Crenichthys baileyi]|uniref:Uncharacterized protein n=1 Tax=Crenichthys baileyi TaxID=28760 RepID=A0AAV9RGV1_9TELE